MRFIQSLGAADEHDIDHPAEHAGVGIVNLPGIGLTQFQQETLPNMQGNRCVIVIERDCG